MTESIITLPLDSIQADTRAQSRAEIDMVVVGEYAEDMKAGAAFPPLVVFHDQTTYWLAEGFHRYPAYQQAEITPVPCIVRPGGLREAILQSLGSNADHGKRRSNADKRRAVEMMLKDSEWAKWSNYEVGRRCAVAESFVRKLKDELGIYAQSAENGKTLAKSSSGKTYTINTGNIRKKVQAEPEPVEPPTFVEPVTESLFVAPGETPEPMFKEDPPFEDEFEDEGGNPFSFPSTPKPEIDDEETQFLAELDAEVARELGKAPPVVAAVTETEALRLEVEHSDFLSYLDDTAKEWGVDAVKSWVAEWLVAQQHAFAALVKPESVDAETLPLPLEVA